MRWLSKFFGFNEPPKEVVSSQDTTAPKEVVSSQDTTGPKVIVLHNEIEGFSILEPIMVHTPDKTLLVFEIMEDEEISDAAFPDHYVLIFSGVTHASMGAPNDEALGGHPLAKYGLRWYQFHVVEQSPLIAELERRNRVHHSHSAALFEGYQHFIITFQGETFEVVCREYNKQIVGGMSTKEVIMEQLKLLSL
jgi:hypothetical protein